jgi:cytochrome P450
MTAVSASAPIRTDIPVPWTVEGQRDPHQWFAYMLAEHPIWYDDVSDVWHIFRYRDVHAFLKDAETHSTRKRIERVPPELRVARLLTTDPPEHTKIRSFFSHAYRPKRVNAMEPHIREVACELLEKAVAKGTFDVVADFAGPLTMTMICEIIGIPPEDREEFGRRAGGASLGALQPTPADGSRPKIDLSMGAAGVRDNGLHAYFRELIERRRAHPEDDLVSDLAKLPPDITTDRLDVGALLGEQLGAGQNTTIHLIGAMIYELLRHPDQLAKLRARPGELVKPAVEEALRFSPPLQARPRITEHDTEFAGYRIREGDATCGWMVAANIDPEVFPDPLRYDVERDPNPHVSFGYGEHYCIGSFLARMEANIALEELLRHTKDFGLASDGEPAWAPDCILRGLQRLDISVVPE